MRRLLAIMMFCPACFDEAPPVDDDGVDLDDDGAAEESSSDDGDASSSDSSGGEADPLDAYGPCEVDSDCELVPGDDGELGSSPTCVQGTCAIRCADASGSGDLACPGFIVFEREGAAVDPIACQDGYCTIQYDPHSDGAGGACPDGMSQSDTVTVPDLDCVWQP